MSLNIIVDADVTSASQKINKFVYSTGQKFNHLQTVINKTSAGFEYGFKEISNNIDNASKRSRIALTNLSLVLQDLPYGFIGIQNNLPFLTQSFTELASKSGGTIAALKQMGSALVGPAGLFLAFSAVTSAVTFAVQKYGSLGNAFDSLFNKTKALSEYQLVYNKAFLESGNNIGFEIAQIKTLVNTLTNSENSRTQQIAAYNKLNEIAPEVIGNLTEENALTDDGRRLIAAKALTLIELLKLRAREKSIGEVLNTLQSQEFAANGKLIAAKNDLARAQANENAIRGKSIKDQERYDRELSIAIDETDFYQTKVNEARQELLNIIKSQNTWTNSLGDTSIKIAQIEQQLKTSTSSTNDLKVAQQELNKEYNAEELALQARYNARKLQDRADKNRLNALEEEIRLQAELTKQTFKEADRVMAQDAAGFTLGMQKLNEITDELKRYEEKFLETRMYLMNVFFRPLTEAFENLFEKGSFNFQELGKTILSTIKKLAAQIIASGIIQLVASLINPIGAVQAGGPKALDLFSILGNAAKNVLSGAVNRPSFAGVQGGGMNMGGQVSVVLRGQDLIGAINRTNLQIERLG